MSTKRYALIAATALATVALSACSGTTPGEPKPWPNVDTGGAVAAPTSATVADNWISLPDTAVPPAERDTAGHRFGPLAPGVGIWEHAAGVATDTGCTLGPAVAPEMNLARRGYLTAGHCDKPDRNQVLTFADAAHTNPEFAGVYTPRKPGSLDATSLWLASDAAAPASIAGHPVAGVLTKSAVSDPKLEGQPVCVYAAVSGLKCGTLVTVDGDEISVDIPTLPGDSGSALFMVNGNTDAATLIGVLTDNSKGSTSYGVVADTALRDLGAKLVTDPAVTIAPRTDAHYSDQAVTAR
ncbi:hypothetical protein [Mycobacteroides abscessus]|uniref:hypothetical protein n=1 Tax=Mycobacteroides abscessus TaxID=36809 RepID=UPI000E696FFF|nr:hypothetical protein [Mycobacteroides abscessus]RIS02757.1 hypothetical protein D2E45_12310 [Mycobacteroides abscessus]